MKHISNTVDRKLGSFRAYLDHAIAQDLVIEEELKFDLELLESAMDYDRDELFGYFGLTTLRDRYLMKERDQDIIGKTQWIFIRVAMGIGNTNEQVVKAYHNLS